MPPTLYLRHSHNYVMHVLLKRLKYSLQHSTTQGTSFCKDSVRRLQLCWLQASLWSMCIKGIVPHKGLWGVSDKHAFYDGMHNCFTQKLNVFCLVLFFFSLLFLFFCFFKHVMNSWTCLFTGGWQSSIRLRKSKKGCCCSGHARLALSAATWKWWGRGSYHQGLWRLVDIFLLWVYTLVLFSKYLCVIFVFE